MTPPRCRTRRKARRQPNFTIVPSTSGRRSSIWCHGTRRSPTRSFFVRSRRCVDSGDRWQQLRSTALARRTCGRAPTGRRTKPPTPSHRLGSGTISRHTRKRCVCGEAPTSRRSWPRSDLGRWRQQLKRAAFCISVRQSSRGGTVGASEHTMCTACSRGPPRMLQCSQPDSVGRAGAGVSRRMEPTCFRYRGQAWQPRSGRLAL